VRQPTNLPPVDPRLAEFVEALAEALVADDDRRRLAVVDPQPAKAEVLPIPSRRKAA
jgi:hypothetical protein